MHVIEKVKLKLPYELSKRTDKERLQTCISFLCQASLHGWEGVAHKGVQSIAQQYLGEKIVMCSIGLVLLLNASNVRRRKFVGIDLFGFSRSMTIDPRWG